MKLYSVGYGIMFEEEAVYRAEVGTVPIPGIVNSTIPPNFGIVREELIPSQGVVEKNWNYRSVVPKNSNSFHHS